MATPVPKATVGRIVLIETTDGTQVPAVVTGIRDDKGFVIDACVLAATHYGVQRGDGQGRWSWPKKVAEGE